MSTKSKMVFISLLSVMSVVGMTLPAYADDKGGSSYSTNNYGNTMGYGNSGQTLTPPQIPGTQTSQITVTLSTGWNLVDSAVNNALNQSGTVHYSDYWTGQTYSTNANSPVDGIWIYSPNGGTVSISPPTQSVLSMMIRPNSWGMIGNPYPTSQSVTLQSGDFAYTYDPSTNQYSSAISGTLTLQPGQGAWVYSANGGNYSVGFQPPAPPSTVTGNVYGSGSTTTTTSNASSSASDS